MALRGIVKEPEDLLRKKSRPVEVFDKKLWSLIDDLKQTMYKVEGIGLAAPQVGILRRVVYIDLGEGEGGVELVNPEIIKQSGFQREIEGCLSCPDKWGYVKRPLHISVKAFDRHGKEFQHKYSSYLARCICHEIDHLDGRLFVDIVDEFVDPKDIKEERERAKKRRKK
ncbi:MAG: peptide deformylase [Oscillospiraceae bacterium]|nr:peptide deformylase [Oscillospiraceae bacterium]